MLKLKQSGTLGNGQFRRQMQFPNGTTALPCPLPPCQLRLKAGARGEHYKWVTAERVHRLQLLRSKLIHDALITSIDFENLSLGLG